jgi:hypothetical protein
LQSIVGAVLDSLSNVAQADVEKAQAATKASGISTRRGSARGNAEALAAENLARGVVRWIDEVDQEVVEGEVMDVVEKEGWNLSAAPLLPVVAGGNGTTSASANAETTSSNSSIHKMCDPVRAPAGLLLSSTKTAPAADTTSAAPVAAPASVQAVTSPVSAAPQTPAAVPAKPHTSAVTSSAVRHLLGSPVAVKRKAAESTPGSVTRSGSKRAAKLNSSIHADAVPVASHAMDVSAPEEASIAHAAPTAVPTSVPAPMASAALPSVEPVPARSSTWAHPVSISSVPHASAGHHISGHPVAPAAATPSALSGGAVKPFNPKPTFLSNILGSNSRLTSFLNAPTFVNTDTAAASSAAPSSSAGTVPPRTGASTMGAPARMRSPLKAMPLTLQEQIKLNAEQRLNKPSGAVDAAGKPVVDRAAKWIKPAPVEESKTLHSALEKRMEELRCVLDGDSSLLSYSVSCSVLVTTTFMPAVLSA